MGSLDPLLRPRSVAVIGASRRRGTIAGEVFHNMVSAGFPGAVYPINKTADVVQSVHAYRSVTDVPGEVDLAVIVVPAAHVLEAVDECGKKAVRAIVIISAGFGETGKAGRELQEEVLARVRRYGMRMVGPNCLGICNADPAVSLDATFSPTFPPFGNVAFSSQSGALGLAILDYARELGLGISQFVSMGNKADVSSNDLLEFWENDDATRVILFYLENLGNPRKFIEIARRVSRKKPIVVVKSGRTEAGARAASSHTGSLAGLDVAVDAILGQAGVLRTDTMDELFDVAMLLANQPVPRGKRVAILTNAGGPGIMASDALESRGLRVVVLPDATQAALRAFLPAEAAVRNPVDMIASASAESYERALRILLEAPEVDAVLVLFVPPIVTEAADVAQAILRGAAHTDKTVLSCFMGQRGVPEAVRELREKRFPSYAFPEAAAAALNKAARYGEWLASPEGKTPVLRGIDRDRAAELIGRDSGAGPKRARWLSPQEVKEILGAYGIAFAKSAEAASAGEAARAAETMAAFPLALKLVSDTITHKSDVGGVVLGLKSASEVEDAYRALEERLTKLGRRAEMQGVQLQAMVHGGVETFVGATRDPEFGHLLGFGIGGVHVELWKDVVFRVAPLCDVDADAMIAQIRAHALLEGFRGGPTVDKIALADVLLRVSALVEAHPSVVELDINPLMALPRGAVAVDARIRVAAK